MVTILLATYNGEKYLRELLSSLLRQTYRDIKIVIRDDCSTDSTCDIILEYAAKHPEKIMLIQSETPSGSAKKNFFELARHKALAGEYFMFCDQDDYWLPYKVEKTLRLMEHTEAGDTDIPVLVHTDLTVTNKELSETAPSFIRFQDLHPKKCSLNYLIVQNNITGCSMMFNSKLLEMLEDTTDIDKVMMHDWWMGLIAAAFGKIAFLDIPTILYRQHGSNEVGAINVHSLAYVKKQLKRIFKSNDEPMENSIQAQQFELDYGQTLTDKQLRLVHAFGHILEYRRFRRLFYFLRYRLFMQSWMRTLFHMSYNIIVRSKIEHR